MNQIQEQLRKLAKVQNTPCVSISLPTHRTHPDNKQDVILLKQLCKNAEHHLLEKYVKRNVQNIIDRLHSLPDEIDPNYNLDSLHVFISEEHEEIVRSPWPTDHTGSQVSEQFALRSLIKGFNRSEEYLILLLSQSGVHLYRALNNIILEEVRNANFPFKENRYYNTHSDKGSDPKHLDDLVREFLNRVDKAVVEVFHEKELKTVAICTEDNYSRLQQVADRPSIYMGYEPIDYNHVSPNEIAAQGWASIKNDQLRRRKAAMEELSAAISQGNVLTDLSEIYLAALDGRADLLLVQEGFSQPVRFTDTRNFELMNDHSDDHSVVDLISWIAWEVISHKGRVVFTESEQLESYGNIALKTRY